MKAMFSPGGLGGRAGGRGAGVCVCVTCVCVCVCVCFLLTTILRGSLLLSQDTGPRILVSGRRAPHLAESHQLLVDPGRRAHRAPRGRHGARCVSLRCGAVNRIESLAGGGGGLWGRSPTAALQKLE